MTALSRRDLLRLAALASGAGLSLAARAPARAGEPDPTPGGWARWPIPTTDRFAVRSAHPRLLLTPAVKEKLLSRKTANAEAWRSLRSRADQLATYAILPYKYATRGDERDNTIFYDYQGEGWYAATMPLALAYQMTGDAAYARKLVQLADEMIRAQSDPDNNPPRGRPPLEPDSYYPTRNLGRVIGVIYDWCYDRLGSVRRTKMIQLMNDYFDDMRQNAYQVDGPAAGNYFDGHLLCAAYMGLAGFGDNPRAQEMIDWARVRYDGTDLAADRPDSFFTQTFDGGYISPYGIRGAPFRGGFDFQGWAYGSGTYSRIIDYLLAVQSASGENLFVPGRHIFSQILRAEKHALLPNRFEIDPTGDWGGD